MHENPGCYPLQPGTLMTNMLASFPDGIQEYLVRYIDDRPMILVVAENILIIFLGCSFGFLIV